MPLSTKKTATQLRESRDSGESIGTQLDRITVQEKNRSPRAPQIKYRTLQIDSLRSTPTAKAGRNVFKLPQYLYYVVRGFFGATRRALPISAIVGCIGGVLAVAGLTYNILELLRIMHDAFGISFEVPRRALRMMNTIVLGVNGSVLVHGAFVGAVSAQHFLCGAKGKITCCRKPGEIPEESDRSKTSASCLCQCVNAICCLTYCCRCLCVCCCNWLYRISRLGALKRCIGQCTHCLVLCVTATVRAVFAVGAAMVLWFSMFILMVFLVSASFR